MNEIDQDYLIAAAFRFEQERGGRLGDFEREILADSGLASIDPGSVAAQLWQALDADLPPPLRGSVYWALGKRHRADDKARLISALQRECPADPNATYQLLIALENIGEKVFAPDRTCRSQQDTAENLATAQRYLADFPSPTS